MPKLVFSLNLALILEKALILPSKPSECLRLNEMFSWAMLRLYIKFQSSAMPRTAQQVCDGGLLVGGWMYKPILLLSLAQAEQLLVGI